MRRYFTILASIFFLTFVTAAASFATPYWLELDVSSLAGSAFELEFDLFDNSGELYDSLAFIDNICIKGSSGVIETVDFEDGTPQGFDDSMNPESVRVLSSEAYGSFWEWGGYSKWWAGDYVMRIDEDPLVTPTITWKDFFPNNATTLYMEFYFLSKGTIGPLGQDALVASLLDPVTLDPLFFGLTGSGDFLEATAPGNDVSTEVTGIEVIPEPSTILLMFSGLGGIVAYGKVRRRKR